jgi:hypothetical protein
MHTKVKALTSFVHGATVLSPGQEAHFTKGDAEELVKSGLAERIGDASEEDDLLGEKAEPAVKNKMADAPANKSGAKSK